MQLFTVRCANVCHTAFTAETLDAARSLHVREHMHRRMRDARREADQAANDAILAERYGMAR